MKTTSGSRTRIWGDISHRFTETGHAEWIKKIIIIIQKQAIIYSGKKHIKVELQSLRYFTSCIGSYTAISFCRNNMSMSSFWCSHRGWFPNRAPHKPTRAAGRRGVWIPITSRGARCDVWEHTALKFHLWCRGQHFHSEQCGLYNQHWGCALCSISSVISALVYVCVCLWTLGVID